MGSIMYVVKLLAHSYVFGANNMGVARMAATLDLSAGSYVLEHYNSGPMFHCDFGFMKLCQEYATGDVDDRIVLPPWGVPNVAVAYQS